jgi:hypothetical protein
MDHEFKILSTIEEQISVQFTGKVNILSNFNHQFLGHILFKNGEIIQVIFHPYRGLKAFYHVIVQEYSLHSFHYVVEPEVVEDKERQIHYPYAVIKNKLSGVLKLYRDSLKYRPPDNVKIVLSAEIIDDTIPLSPQEFDVMITLTEWNSTNDVYQHCQLLDHEITMALVGLRKKGALRIISNRNIP